MADQASVSLSFVVESTNFQDNKTWDFTDTLAKQGLGHGIQTVTTAYSALTIGDLSSTDQGLCVLNNLDTANYIEYGSTDGEFKLNAGEFAKVRFNSGKTIQAKANTASVKIEKYLLAE